MIRIRSAVARSLLVVIIAAAVSLPWLNEQAMNNACGARRLSPDEKLIESAWCGNEQGIVSALRAGASPDARCRAGMTPLMSAAACGNARVVRLLLRNGAAARATERYGNTAAFHARMFGHREIERLLLKSEAQQIASARNLR